MRRIVWVTLLYVVILHDSSAPVSASPVPSTNWTTGIYGTPPPGTASPVPSTNRTTGIYGTTPLPVSTHSPTPRTTTTYYSTRTPVCLTFEKCNATTHLEYEYEPELPVKIHIFNSSTILTLNYETVTTMQNISSTNDTISFTQRNVTHISDDSSVLVIVTRDFSQIMIEYLGSNAANWSGECIARAVHMLNDSLKDEIELVGVYMPFIVTMLKKEINQETKKIKHGELIIEYKKLLSALKKILAEDRHNFTKIKDIIVGIIGVLKQLKDITKDLTDKAMILAEIERKEKEKVMLELHIRYIEILQNIRREDKNDPRDTEKLIELVEDMIKVLGEIKESNDCHAAEITRKEIDYWKKMKCILLWERYRELVQNLRAELQIQNGQKIIDLQKKIIAILEKIKKCCPLTEAKKDAIQKEIDKRNKHLKHNELILIYKDLKKQIQDEENKKESERNWEKLADLYHQLINILEKLKGLDRYKNRKKKIDQDIESLRDRKCEALKRRYNELLAEKLTAMKEKPQNLDKTMKIDEKIIGILEKIKKCCAKTEKEKDDIDAKIEFRKYLIIVNLEFRKCILTMIYYEECRRFPQNRLIIRTVLQNILEILKDLLKRVDPAEKPKIQNEIDQIQKEIEKFEG